MIPLLIPTDSKQPRRAVIFMSGSGANAERILQQWRASDRDSYRIEAIVTDRPETSRAQLLAAQFDVPMIGHDIRAFYRARGERRISIATEIGREIRAAWTDELRSLLQPAGIELGIFAGFVPLCNIAADFPCLNVHPGDLTVLRAGERYLVGLHTVPIERAILFGLNSLRSSVIQVEPYIAGGNNMDAGPLLGISPEVPIDLQGHSLDFLRATAAARPERRPIGGFRDTLEAIADANQQRLKHGGDLLVFPPVVRDFANGCFAHNPAGQLCYRVNSASDWQPVATIAYGDGTSAPISLSSTPH
jgi:folate-dependent phosphoribosylglycinamide formyltransferase PurN